MKRKVSENSLKNLKLFEKGHAPCGGRPKGSVSLVSIIERALKQEITLKNPLTKQDCKKEVQEWVVNSLLAKAIKGDVSAIKEVLERVDGKVPNKNEMTGKDGDPIEIDSNLKLTVEEMNNRIALMLE